jgi:shikimate dehydrogenase
MFNAVFRGHSVNAVYNRIAADTAEEAVFLFKELGLGGMNVTAPFKQDIMGLLDTIESPADRVKGVNTVVGDQKGLRGFNTDYLGVVGALKQGGIPPRERQCIVLGAGGAGRAAAYGLTRQKADVIIVNRTFPRALEAANMFGCRAERIEKLEKLLAAAAPGILISTLPTAVDIIPPAWLHKDLVVFDANYKKSFLLDHAQKAGCRIIKGEEWLLNQAIPAYRYFLGGEPGRGAEGMMRKALLAPPPVKPRNIALVGFMGSGKTTVGKLLAAKMGLSFKDTDHLIEIKEGKNIPAIFRTDGEGYFREIEKALLKKELAGADETHPGAGVVYGCGGGIVLDDENKEILKENALVIWLYSSIPTTLRRLGPGAAARPLLDCADPAEKAGELLARRIFHYARTADLIVGSEKSAEATAEKIYDEIDKTFAN